MHCPEFLDDFFFPKQAIVFLLQLTKPRKECLNRFARSGVVLAQVAGR